ncbi:hypothetical protein AKJ09_02438 [Labilithrix luteola]|uniref:Uncharacterized protein n=1 Tax=Labilithrix luteola TaxID=1391654 RepID=A0A0K1PRN7_9BACT|nr:hypothetical protein AKJ09_02438 [Labilithrix luteola]
MDETLEESTCSEAARADAVAFRSTEGLTNLAKGEAMKWQETG